jgi:tetratricopeptide (TPR) repeat protein
MRTAQIDLAVYRRAVSSARSGLQHARHLAEVGRYADAERCVREALAGSPTDAEMLTFLGYVLRAQEHLLESLDACDAAVAAAPESAQAHGQRAETLLAIHRDRQAVEAATEAVRLSPQDADLHVILARALSDLNEHARARETAHHALTLAPQSVNALLALARIEYAAGDKAAAARAVRSALALDPTNTEGRWLLGMFYADRLKVGRSMRSLRQVAHDQPDQADLESLLWPLERALGGLRWWLPAAVVLVACAAVATSWLGHRSGAGLGVETAARLVAGLAAFGVVGVLARVLLPAGRTPWQCLGLVTRLFRAALITGFVTAIFTVMLLAGYARTGWWPLPVLALAGPLVLWASRWAARFGARMDDPGVREYLRGDFAAELREIGQHFRDWPKETRRELREAWDGPDSDKSGQPH